LAPTAARIGERVLVSGNGFPDAVKVWLDLKGNPPDFASDVAHIGTPILDGCGHFEFDWIVPPTVSESGSTRFRVNATGQNARGDDVQDGSNEANTEFTLIP